MVAGLQEHRLSHDLVNASVPICWETHILIHQGEQISPGRGRGYIRHISATAASSPKSLGIRTRDDQNAR